MDGLILKINAKDVGTVIVPLICPQHPNYQQQQQSQEAD